ncbi:hypothetical protein K469DRAFT_695884 [Zopfia rhizophila CBS 207.26]|uniref:Uncharacterized protein n=1 Tax=Zopfia rhizophila CBS 207.26 TaxID=1314779 RepID=A0A6A6EPC3_9PEZI|nr:hypothetical protein K469DRAFT_695884 [Zopfia rhizophila CBS 207.26]
MPSESYPVYQRPQRVRLLYRELKPDENRGSRTLPQLVTTLIPVWVLFQHWAVEVGERGNAHRFELEYYSDGSKLRVTRPGDPDPNRASYEEFPYGHRHIWGGKTSKSLKEIPVP